MRTLKFFKFLFILSIFFILSLHSLIVSGLETSDHLDQAIRRYLSIYNNYQVDENIDEDVVNGFTELMRDYSYGFSYLAMVETDEEFLPYLEKYSNLKLKFTGHPIDPNVRVVFIKDSPDYAERISRPAFCDPFTRIIFVDPNVWELQEAYERTRKKERILFHELAHCDLYRNDDPTGDISFMRIRHLERLLTSQDDPVDLDHIFEELYEELFSQQNTWHTDCYAMEINDDGIKEKIIPDYCTISQREAFQNFKLTGFLTFQRFFGSSSLGNNNNYPR